MAGTTSDKLALLRQIKESFRTAITGKGQTISSDEPFSAWPAKVTAIQTGVDTSDATATSDNIMKYYTAYVKGNKIAGSLGKNATVTYEVVNNSSYDIQLTATMLISGMVTIGASNITANSNTTIPSKGFDNELKLIGSLNGNFTASTTFGQLVKIPNVGDYVCCYLLQIANGSNETVTITIN